MSSTYCKLPFVHLYTQADGELKPCCIAGGFDEPINLKQMSIEDAFNSPQMKELRKVMLEGKRNKVCDVCYQREDSTGHSPRIDFNKNPLWIQPKVKDDFSVPSDFQHIDIRFSNLCNFKCRMCNHDFSSNWYHTLIIVSLEDLTFNVCFSHLTHRSTRFPHTARPVTGRGLIGCCVT